MDFDRIFWEYFCNFWEKKLSSVSSCSLLWAPDPCLRTLVSVAMEMYSSQTATGGPLVSPQEHIVSFCLVLFGLSIHRNPHFLDNPFYMARHWWMDGQREQIILNPLRCPSQKGHVEFWWVNSNENLSLCFAQVLLRTGQSFPQMGLSLSWLLSNKIVSCWMLLYLASYWSQNLSWYDQSLPQICVGLSYNTCKLQNVFYISCLFLTHVLVLQLMLR